MREVRFHGRGGQGAVVASTILAEAAFMEGNDVQAFPFFGVERRGAPVTAFTRIDKKKIRIKTAIYEPDYVVILDPTLVGAIDVTQGIKPGGAVLINTKRSPEDFNFSKDVRVATVDATSIALKYGIGSKAAPIVNTAIVGAFSKVTGEVDLETVLESIKRKVSIKTLENIEAAKEAYNLVTSNQL